MALHGGDLLSAREKYGALEFCDFSANINPLGPPQGVFDAIRQNIADIIHYPDPQGRRLKSLLSGKLGVPPEQLILGNGAVELIYLLAHALKPSKGLIPAPSFAEYARALQAVGSGIRYKYLKPEQGFKLEFKATDFVAVDIVFLCNPNNPTGSFLSAGEFRQILQMAREENVLVVVDESFMDFVEPQEQWRAYHYLQEYERLFVLYSLTKFYAIPGLRLGCGIGSPELIQTLERLKDPWNVNNLALAAGEAALVDREFAAATREFIAEQQAFLATELSQLPDIKIYPGRANFILFEIKAATKEVSLVDALAKRGILIRSCANFPGLGENFFRIAIKDQASNLKLINALREILIA